MRYLPATEAQITSMLEAIGIPDLPSLFSMIPEELHLPRELDLPQPMTEEPLLQHLTELAQANKPLAGPRSFLGGGAYDHYGPALVDQILIRSEFYTAYTPYQPEVSQGTLQAIFEFQTMICQLFEMDVANASLYDGGSALAEAVLLVDRLQKRGQEPRILVSDGINPQHAEALCTYLRYRENITLEPVELDSHGVTDLDAMRQQIEGAAAVVVAYPNCLGNIEDLAQISAIAKEAKAKLVVSVPDPIAMGLLRGPGAFGADIVCGEGQGLGIPPSFGGPGVGLFAVNKKHMRKMPGRLCGQTTDVHGKRGYVLTLSTREQHIRRGKATSNICTNQGLMALAATIYMALMGKQGMREVAHSCHSKAAYLRRKIGELDGFTIPYDAPFFHEFAVEYDGDLGALMEGLEARGFYGGIPIDEASGRFLVCVTERNDRLTMDEYVDALAELRRAQA